MPLAAQNREVIYECVHGIADPETGELLTRDHRFRLASVSKQLTGVAVMILKEEGKISFDDEIKKFLPELPYEGITIKHLLTHTSGLPNYGALPDKYWDPENRNSIRRKTATNENVYEYLLKHAPPAVFNPGDRYKYCNTGYNLLALIIEKASGMFFQEFMQTSVFNPAGMKSSFINAYDGSLPDVLRARGFKLNPDMTGYVISDRHYQNGMVGDGGVYSTITDMFRYDQALYGNDLVKQETLQEAFSGAKLNNGEKTDYGFGWSIFSDSRGNILAHGGAWAGFSAFFIRDYENGNTIIQLTNRPGIRRGELAFAIYEILHGGEYRMPRGSIADVMLKRLHQKDVKSALKKYYELKKNNPQDYDFSESELNRLGYRLLNQNRIDDAVRIFKENAKLFPDSWNVYDSLAEAYMKNDERKQAIRYYEKSLSLNPGNVNAQKMIEKLKN